MEIWINKEWAKTIIDVYPGVLKMANLVLTLAPKSDAINQCDLAKSIPEFYKSDTARCRFKIIYAKKIGDSMPYLTTEAFKLNR